MVIIDLKLLRLYWRRLSWKKSAFFYVKRQEICDFSRFFTDGSSLKLYNFVTKVDILKIQKHSDWFGISLSFWFSGHGCKTIPQLFMDINLKAVRGGESALAMAKRRYTTVIWPNWILQKVYLLDNFFPSGPQDDFLCVMFNLS